MVAVLEPPPARRMCADASRTPVAVYALPHLKESAMVTIWAGGSLPCTMTAGRVPRACAGRPSLPDVMEGRLC